MQQGFSWKGFVETMQMEVSEQGRAQLLLFTFVLLLSSPLVNKRRNKHLFIYLFNKPKRRCVFQRLTVKTSVL